MSSFKDLDVFLSENPVAEAQKSYAPHALSLSCHLSRHALLWASDLGYCERKTLKSIILKVSVAYLTFVTFLY